MYGGTPPHSSIGEEEGLKIGLSTLLKAFRAPPGRPFDQRNRCAAHRTPCALPRQMREVSVPDYISIAPEVVRLLLDTRLGACRILIEPRRHKLPTRIDHDGTYVTLYASRAACHRVCGMHKDFGLGQGSRPCLIEQPDEVIQLFEQAPFSGPL